MCGTIFNPHEWKQSGIERVCKKCGKKQTRVYEPDADGLLRPWWKDAKDAADARRADDSFVVYEPDSDGLLRPW